MPHVYHSLGDSSIVVEYAEKDLSYAEEALGYVSEAIGVLCGYFDCAGQLPAIRTMLVPDRSEFDRCVKDVLGVEIEVPSSPVRIGQPQRNELVLLSPRAYEKDFHTYSPDAFRKLVIHEMTHVVEEHLSRNIEALPRWWSEGLAMLLSQHWQEELPHVLEGIESRRIPSITEMQDGAVTDPSVRLCYRWGWTIVAHIHVVQGKGAVVRVVRECEDGDVFGVLGSQPEALEADWRRWLSATDLSTLDPVW